MERTYCILPESEAKPESFHDCHVYDLVWRPDRFSFSMDIQYILEWATSVGTTSATLLGPRLGLLHSIVLTVCLYRSS
jgi:hypothetical protein